MAEATISSAVVSTSGFEIVVTCSADNPPLLPSTGMTGFLIGGVSPAITVLSAYRSKNSEITLELSRGILSSETGVTLSYISGNVTDSTPENLQTTIGVSVTNSSEFGDQFVTGSLRVLDEDGSPEEGAIIYCEMIVAPSSETGYSYDSKIRTFNSDSVGEVEIPNLVKGATYRIWRGIRTQNSAANKYLIPANASSPYSLPSQLGKE